MSVPATRIRTAGPVTLLGLLKLLDLVLIGAACLVAATISTPAAARWQRVLQVRVSLPSVLFFAAYFLYWHGALRIVGAYRCFRLARTTREELRLCLAVALGMVPTWALAGHYLPSGTPVRLALVPVLALAGLMGGRCLVRLVAPGMRRHGGRFRHALILADRAATAELKALLARRPHLAYAVLEQIEVDEQSDQEATLAHLSVLLEREPIDEVLIAVPLDRLLTFVREVVALCEERGTTVRLLPEVVEPALAEAHTDVLDGRPVLTIHNAPPRSHGPTLKHRRLFTGGRDRPDPPGFRLAGGRDALSLEPAAPPAPSRSGPRSDGSSCS